MKLIETTIHMTLKMHETFYLFHHQFISLNKIILISRIKYL